MNLELCRKPDNGPAEDKGMWGGLACLTSSSFGGGTIRMGL